MKLSQKDQCKEGSLHKSKSYGEFRVVKYIDAESVVVRFTATGYETTIQSGNVVCGSVKDKMHPTKCGVGFIGVGPHKSRINKKPNKIYSIWSTMIARCYDKSCASYSRYGGAGIVVDNAWHNFQSFADWYVGECIRLGVNPYAHKYQIDKDILGGREYSPVNCMLVTPHDNAQEAHSKVFRFKSSNGDIVEVYNLSRFCADNGLNNTCMHNVSTGRYKSHKGYTRA